MAGSIATAYVQIVPSAEGISSGISKALGGEATTAGKSFGKTMVSKIKSVIAAAGIGTAIKQSLEEGAALQQSLGGVETLFKENAETVKQYAYEAYKTAGVSANSYMEQVTSFSASLLQSMGGDTAAAAEVAHMAMVDMSDNANKFGTDMQNIQNAYQGFAKQNYTMLDNLKLGYGGTKSEMERLLADAQELTGVKYDISNLNDVYSAIHAIQENLGVTGTTALEAATTFSGSMASMKAALSNFLGNLSLGEDIMPALQALFETTKTFLVGNLLPMVGNIFSSIGKLAADAILGVLGTDLATITEQLAGVFDPVMESLQRLKETVMTAFEPIITKIQEYISSGQGAADITTAIKTAAETLSAILVAVIDGISNFITWLTSGSAGAEAFKAAVVAVVAALGTFKIISTVTGLFSSLTSIVGIVKTALTAVWAVMSANPIGLIVAAIAGLVAGFMYLRKNCESFREFWQNLWEGIKSFASSAAAAVSAVFEGIKSTITNVLNTVKSVVQGKLDNIKSAFDSNGGGLKGTVAAVWEGIKGYYTAGFEVIDSLTGGKLSAIANSFKDKMNSARDGVKNAIDKIKSFFNFSWSLPSLKLPHFSISGSFSLNPPSVPHFSISWYKNGGILDGAQIFGMSGSTLLGGGEAGKEAVLPLTEFYKELESIIGKRSSGSDGSTEIVINVYPAQGQDERTIAQMVKEELYNEYLRTEAALT